MCYPQFLSNFCIRQPIKDSFNYCARACSGEGPEETSARNMAEFYREELLDLSREEFIWDRSDPVIRVLKKYVLVEGFRMSGVYRFRPTEKALKLLRECAHPHWINI